MSTPDYVLVSDMQLFFGPGDPVLITAGSFVRPIDIRYVPKHIKERHPLHASTQVYCYTSIGIVPIDKKLIRRTPYV